MALATTQQLIEAAMPLDMEDPAMQQLMMMQLLADDGNPSCTEILPHLDLGRGNANYCLLLALD